MTAALILAAAACGFAPPGADAPRPNVVVVMADDMGYSDAGCYGGEIATPHLDSLAAGGLRFTRFYNTGRCCPTRASLLSGHYPHAAGMGWMISDRGTPGYAGSLRKDRPTLAELLKPAGYRAYMTGKWHVTPHTGKFGPKDNWPLARGFDRYYGTISGAGDYYDPATLVRQDTAISAFDDPERPAEYRPDGSGYHYTDAISDEAVRFVAEHAEQNADDPFLLYVAYTSPHWPLHAPPGFVSPYEGVYDEGFGAIRETRLAKMKSLGLLGENTRLTPAPKAWGDVPRDRRAWEADCMEVYAAMVAQMDAGIGRLLAELDRTGQAENTLVLFLQDNGGCAEAMNRDKQFTPRPAEPPFPPMAADAVRTKRTYTTREGYKLRRGVNVTPGPPDTFLTYGEGWANVSNTPFRLYKHWVHEGGIATPLIARWPAGMRDEMGGTLVADRAHLIDLAPTLLELAGAEYPAEFGGSETKPLPGESLVPDLTGQMRIAVLDDRPLFWEHEGNRAVSRPDGDGDWKLVAKSGGPWELYDLSDDRTELNDRADAKPELVAELAGLWDDWAAANDVLPLEGWRGKPKNATR